MSILKTSISLQVLIVNKILVTNNIGGIKSSNKLIKKFIKPKTAKLSKLRNLKGKKLFKSQNLANSREKLSKIEIYLILILWKLHQVL